MLVWKGHKAKVRSLAFSPDGRYIATTSGHSRFVWLWETTTGQLVRKFSGYRGPARGVAFFPDGRCLAGVHEHECITVWEVETGAVCATLGTGNRYPTDALAISPDGARIVVFTDSRFLEWDDPVRPASAFRRPDRIHGPGIGFYFLFRFGFSPRGTYFWRNPGDLVLYDPRHLTTEWRRLKDPLDACADGCAFTPDEARICVAFQRRVVVWRLDDPDALPVELRGHDRAVRGLGFLPGGGTVLSAAMDGTVRLWDATTGAETRSLDWGIGNVRHVAVAPDGLTCAAGGDSGQIVVWDVDG